MAKMTVRWAVLLGIAAPLFLSACKEETAAVGTQPAPVRVMAVKLEQAASIRSYTGTVRPRYESDISFRVAGKIVERSVNVGDNVKAGQLIARLDATDYRLDLESQEAELAAAKTSRDSAVAAEKRQRRLKKNDWVSQAAVDQAIAAADEARARVDRAERALTEQRNQVAYTELRADHDGVVSTVVVEAGQVVTAGQVVARIARLDELEAVVSIPERHLNDLKSATAVVEIWPATDKTYELKLREVAAEADPLSRTFQARFTIVNPGDDVRLGKTIKLILSADDGKPVIRLPLSAVMNDAKGPLVWVVNAAGDRIARRAVTVQAFEQDSVLLSSGLRQGERVVTLGVHMLDEAKAVRIVETKTQTSARERPIASIAP